jgi:hypothetical protein
MTKCRRRPVAPGLSDSAPAMATVQVTRIDFFCAGMQAAMLAIGSVAFAVSGPRTSVYRFDAQRPVAAHTMQSACAVEAFRAVQDGAWAAFMGLS